MNQEYEHLKKAMEERIQEYERMLADFKSNRGKHPLMDAYKLRIAADRKRLAEFK